MDSSKGACQYGAFYYAHDCGQPYQRSEGWLNFFGSIAERIVHGLRPGTVLDAGCAMGFLVEKLRERGVEAFGIDISEYAINQVQPHLLPYCQVGSVTKPLARQYDLIVCIEVLEHLPLRESELAIQNFCEHTDDILFSSTPLDYKEATHVNVHPIEYWAELFAQQGFFRDIDFDASFITAWAARFRRVNQPVARTVAGYERRLWQLEQEIRALRETAIQQHAELAEKEHLAETLTAQLNGLATSRSVRWAQKLGRIRAQFRL